MQRFGLFGSNGLLLVFAYRKLRLKAESPSWGYSPLIRETRHEIFKVGPQWRVRPATRPSLLGLAVWVGKRQVKGARPTMTDRRPENVEVTDQYSHYQIQEWYTNVLSCENSYYKCRNYTWLLSLSALSLFRRILDQTLLIPDSCI